MKDSAMLLLDIGANRGDAVLAGLRKGYKVVAVEAAPRIYAQLVKNFLYNPNVVPLRFAVSSLNNERIEFYECVEDGLSTINKSWLTQEGMPYAGKKFRTVGVTTCTIDWLVEKYGMPELIKIDVEGAEWEALRGITKKYNKITFEWTYETLNEHEGQLAYLMDLGYSKVAPEFIGHHLDEPDTWYDLNNFLLKSWVDRNAASWEKEGWKKARLRPTADVGMVWVK